MAYTNSPLVDFTLLSPNHSGQRTHAIDTITIHHMAGNLSVESCGKLFATTNRQASSNYGIGTDGRVGLYVEEANRSWCSSNRENDNRAVTIEVANDDTTSGNWHVSDTALAKLIDLCVDICQRNGIPKLVFTGDKSGNLTMHKWFASTLCPGPYLESKFPYISEEVNRRLAENSAGGKSEEKTQEETMGTPASIFQNLSTKEAVEKIGELCRKDMQKSGILGSISAAQIILESGYGKAELAQKANNFCGMKASLSGNTWAGSTWDGSSVYSLDTQEQNPDGSYVAITANFRKYTSVEDSIADHSAYLLGAMNGSKKRYDGLAGCTDYKRAAQIIKDGGYATDLGYVDKLCSLIERWDLTQFDIQTEATDCYYRVRKSWSDARSQLGAYKVLANAKKCADKNPGYTVYDSIGKAVYPESQNEAAIPFRVKVSIDNLNIRKGPGTNYARTGYFTGKGVFTIVEVKSGVGSNSGWGRLKSGAGWVSLDYTTCVI